MSVEVELQEEFFSKYNPSLDLLQLWVDSALNHVNNPPATGDITIKIIDKEESAVLNQTFRHKQGPTNILSFPYDSTTDEFVGDLAICAELVEQEAHDQGKLIIAHWAHLVIHGVLHLMDYDHIEPSDARIMEALETEIMSKLEYEDPYAED